ncbi:MAG TPA: hypothetical protein VGO93_18730 [Candidatus Xenobia bacterium]|jgi:hypothetical protein
MRLSKNPFYVSAVRHQTRGWLRMAGEGVLGCGVLVGGTAVVGRIWLGVNELAGLTLAMVIYALWTVLCLMVLFGLWAAAAATQLVGRDKEPHRLEMVLSTGMSIPYLMKSQWLASIYPFALLVVGFGMFGGWQAALAATLGVLAGAGLGIVFSYRIRLASLRPVLLAILCLELVYLVLWQIIP